MRAQNFATQPIPPPKSLAKPAAPQSLFSPRSALRVPSLLLAGLFLLSFCPFLLGGAGGCGNLLSNCSVDADCAAGQLCQKGVCQPKSGPSNECQKDADCPASAPRCILDGTRYVCRKGCTSDQDCSPGTCLNHLCQSPPKVIDKNPVFETKQVDLLFVVDNSGSMAEEQAKLSRNFKSFITELLTKQINDFHIGIITTDMDNCQRDCGRLQGTPKILTKNMSPKEIRDAFAKNAVVGTTGSPYEKGLAAVRAALSKPLIDDPSSNKGFLRPDALLAVFFVTDENDCSHNGSIPEAELHSEVCHVPPSEVVLGPDGKPRLDSKGNKVYGYMDRLLPVSQYTTFFKNLGRPLVLAGLIGNPTVNNGGGCSSDSQCQVGSKSYKCSYASAKNAQDRRCGGCKSTDADAVPGFRYKALMDSLGQGHNWFSICGDDAGFVKALLHFARQIIGRLDFFELSQIPADPSQITVKIVPPRGQEITVPRASATSTPCQDDSQCQSDGVCGADAKCYGDGWVYFPPTVSFKARIKLSGRYKKIATPGSTMQVSYKPR